ncbi:MAG: hypothetical protein ACTSU2_14040 [Promethearchaeota archaeon]
MSEKARVKSKLKTEKEKTLRKKIVGETTEGENNETNHFEVLEENLSAGTTSKNIIKKEQKFIKSVEENNSETKNINTIEIEANTTTASSATTTSIKSNKINVHIEMKKPVESLTEAAEKRGKSLNHTSFSTASNNALSIPLEDAQNNTLKPYIEEIDDYQQQINAELSPIEKDVLDIAKEIMKLKKYPAQINTDNVQNLSPIVEKIYSKAIGKLHNQKGYSKDQIFNAIKSLEKKKFIVTNQRMTKLEILNNDLKKKILAFIKKYPGIHARDEKIKKILGISRNPFIKHMMTLEAFGLIRTKKIGATLNYFPKDMPEIFDDLAVLFHNNILVEIIKCFIEKPDIKLMELSEKLGVFHRAIQYHLKKLVELNILIPVQYEDFIKSSGDNPALKDPDDPSVDKDKRRKYYLINKELLKRYNMLFKVPPFSEWLD